MTDRSESTPPPGTYRPLTVGTGMRATALHSPDKVALIEGDRRLTFARFVERADRLSGLLDGLALPDRCTVAILAPNCIEYIEVVVGASEAGHAVTTLNPKLTAREIGAICDDCGARLMFVHPSLEELARAVPFVEPPMMVVLGEAYEDALTAARPRPPRLGLQEWDTFSLPYTSGTTGKPKGVMLPHRSRVMAFFGMASEFGCYGPDDEYLAIAPLFHGAGLCFAMGSIYFGGTCEILPRFEPEAVIAKLGVKTGTFMVPTHFNALFALEPTLLERAKTHRLRTIVSNAAPLPQVMKERIVGLWGEGILHEVYGSTEGGNVTNLRPRYQLVKERCVGKPFPCTQVRLLGEDGREVLPGEVGELFSNSPYLFNGYHGKPAETAAALRDGWFSAGDLARRDEEGFLYLVDRKKDLIITGGVNVYPREIEEVLFRHPALADVAVIGEPDAHWGESVCAIVVPKAGSVPDPDEVAAFCKADLAGFKTPRRVIVRQEPLPRNAAGKVLKGELRTYAAETRP